MGFKGVANNADTAVHHVGRCNDVCTGLCLSKHLFNEHFDGFVVKDEAGLVDKAVLTVSGVRVERDIAHHSEFGEVFFQRTHYARNQAVRIGCFSAVGCL